ncbi:CPBP family intramembrane glutamic endopeptidase [Caproicibacterium sp. BJN0003]|uniref:CPBP family intramembrane glutamic endopeptidase n=1 Tax=Caproicibacterium sp. BJN0003 TaxID=2994078 RepID=UPI00225C36F3|nr:CPBP family intramembrane glutamic endopeptidase [Caproicibacterium sp. BJN0003]UZT81731.1 CPBP family intramembrane metalloprotease [Caproicibacterium sp. BJN0003]
MSRNYVRIIFKIVIFLFILQLLRIGIKSVCFLVVDRTYYSDRIASLFAMVLLSALILLVAKFRRIDLSIFPKHFGAGYIIFTVIAFALFVSTPILTKNNSTSEIVLLIYSAIVTPVFEELIFRGFVWNKLNTLFKKEWITYVMSTLLFAVWHFGYIDTIAFHVETGLANAIIWKVITGFCFGIVLGALRLKTKNCYSTMLLHGVLNIFGR